MGKGASVDNMAHVSRRERYASLLSATAEAALTVGIVLLRLSWCGISDEETRSLVSRILSLCTRIGASFDQLSLSRVPSMATRVCVLRWRRGHLSFVEEMRRYYSHQVSVEVLFIVRHKGEPTVSQCSKAELRVRESHSCIISTEVLRTNWTAENGRQRKT